MHTNVDWSLFKHSSRKSRLIAGCEPMVKRLDSLKLKFFGKLAKLDKRLLARQVFDTSWKATEIACGIYEEKCLKNFSVCIEFRNLLCTYGLGKYWIPENFESKKAFKSIVDKSLNRFYLEKENQTLLESRQTLFLIHFTGLHRKKFSKSLFRGFPFGNNDLKWFIRFISGNIPFRWKEEDKD